MKCIFIYNPNSGRGSILKKLDYIKKRLEEKYSEVVIYPTKSQADTKAIAKDSCERYDAIIFSGGDGTFNDIACGVSRSDIRPPLGYIPSGTVNDIARNLGISRRIKKALKTILDGHLIYHDVGKINNRFFLYVAAVGTFTGVSYRTKQKTKKIFGRLAYAFDGLKDVISPINSDIIVTTETETLQMKVPLLLVINSISVGGVPINRYGHLNDGLFDIVLVKKGVGNGLLNILKLFTFGIRIKKITKHFVCLKSSKFSIDVGDDVIWTIDGEAGPKGKVEIENIHNHLQIFVPLKRQLFLKRRQNANN